MGDNDTLKAKNKVLVIIYLLTISKIINSRIIKISSILFVYFYEIFPIYNIKLFLTKYFLFENNNFIKAKNI